jgi:hypothetical protein
MSESITRAMPVNVSPFSAVAAFTQQIIANAIDRVYLNGFRIGPPPVLGSFIPNSNEIFG